MSTDLITVLTSQLGVSSQQASGGAGLLFKMAQEKLSSQQFSQVAAAVPEASRLLGAAPPAGGGGIVGMLGKAMGGKAGDLAALAGGFSKLGMDASMIQKFLPILLGYVQQQGGAGVAGVLQQALKR